MRIASSFDKWRHVLEESLPCLDKYASVYKDLYQYPELACQESRTAAVVAHHRVSLGYGAQRNIGGHGVIGILTKGAGKTVLLRSELDVLPMQEAAGLPHASIRPEFADFKVDIRSFSRTFRTRRS